MWRVAGPGVAWQERRGLELWRRTDLEVRLREDSTGQRQCGDVGSSFKVAVSLENCGCGAGGGMCGWTPACCGRTCETVRRSRSADDCWCYTEKATMAPLTDHAQDSTAKSTRESSRQTSTSAATQHNVRMSTRATGDGCWYRKQRARRMTV